jgi:enoyl-[acyl-carrier protein] reductase II
LVAIGIGIGFSEREKPIATPTPIVKPFLLMLKTRVCELFGIEYPILQGGMLRLANAELAAAVSNAGALGIISPYAGMGADGDPLENLRRQVLRSRRLTEKPFGINIPLDLPESGLLIDLLLRENVQIVVTSAGSPEIFGELLHSAGIRVVHVISSVAQAQFAESCNIDAIIAEGAEAGGRLGLDELSLFSLVPQVADAVSLPIIAAGGIADGRGMAAAFALGAAGVQLGTRFIAAEECIAHPGYKQAIIDAGDTDTTVMRRGSVPARILKSMEGYAGSSAGLVKKVIPAAQIVQELIRGYHEVIGSAAARCRFRQA